MLEYIFDLSRSIRLSVFIRRGSAERHLDNKMCINNNMLSMFGYPHGLITGGKLVGHNLYSIEIP